MIGINNICLGIITRVIEELLYWAEISGRIRQHQKNCFGRFCAGKTYVVTNFSGNIQYSTVLKINGWNFSFQTFIAQNLS
jgi:hypothetical protein